MEFNCSCMRIKLFGIPCEHIVCVLVHEDIEELPRSLVLPRWTKTAKVGLQNAVGFHWDSLMLSQYGCLMDWFRQLANFACQDNERFIFTQEMAMNLLKQLKEEDAAQKELVNDVDSVRDDVQVNASGAGLATNDLGHSVPMDPRKYRTKWGVAQSNKRKHQYGQCGMKGHNRTTCYVYRGISPLEGHGIDTFDNDLDDHMNIEDDSLVIQKSVNKEVISAHKTKLLHHKPTKSRATVPSHVSKKPSALPAFSLHPSQKFKRKLLSSHVDHTPSPAESPYCSSIQP
ncbi:hypothetical protein Ahy_B02g059297 [Arachis hypogaea]|uniref:Protein FAR1-RELATED SEQUENCE n=1 Tax=Arachis hypogaea TaxID=3818 RepID=A0A445AGD3_ARAHY|nr:hypothetical protein Ahy_B02g059297 [Arachis hypogaea]